MGAAIGNTVAIHNVIASLATVGLVGEAGRVIRLNLIPLAYYLLAGGVVVMLTPYLVTPHIFFEQTDFEQPEAHQRPAAVGKGTRRDVSVCSTASLATPGRRP